MNYLLVPIMETPPMAKEEFTVAEVADLLDVHPSTIWREVKSGKFGEFGKGWRRKTPNPRSHVLILRPSLLRYARQVGKALALAE